MKLYTVIAAAAVLSVGSSVAFAQSYSTSFEYPDFAPGPVNGQSGWSNTGPFNANVTNAAARSGNQSFVRDQKVGSGSFGNQTFSPGIGVGVGEPSANGVTAGYNVLTTTVWFKAVAPTADNTWLEFAPTDANGSRAFGIVFDNYDTSGIRVYGFGTSWNGSSTSFVPTNLTPILLSRTSWHKLTAVATFVPGANNDVVQYFINDAFAGTSATWEEYYRNDPEQAGNGNQLWAVDRAIWKTSFNNPNSSGFYFDDFSMQAVPEPGTIAAIATGLAGLAGLRRRRA